MQNLFIKVKKQKSLFERIKENNLYGFKRYVTIDYKY